MEVQENRAVAYHEVCIEVQENLAVAMNVNIPPTHPPEPVNKHNDQNHAETEKVKTAHGPLTATPKTCLYIIHTYIYIYSFLTYCAIPRNHAYEIDYVVTRSSEIN